MQPGWITEYISMDEGMPYSMIPLINNSREAREPINMNTSMITFLHQSDNDSLI